VLLDVHVTTRPVSTIPFASLVTAVSCFVGVTPKTKVAELGLTVTVATGTGLTVMVGVGVELTDSLVAVTVAVPCPTADTVTVAPLPVLTELAGLTVSTDGLLDTQLTVRPDRTLLFTSFGKAVRTCVPPTGIGVVGVESVTVLTGASVTVSEDVPVLVSLVAVIVVLPAPTAVTRPFASTVAAARLLEIHVTTRPVSTLLLTSVSVAVNCCVGVTPKTRLAVGGVTVTELTGASDTVIEDVPVLVSLVAVIVAAPAATVVTRPFASTVATALLFEDQVTVRPVSTVPLTSVSVAVNCCVGVIPTTRLAEVGVTVTVLTGASVTVIEDVPVFVSLVAVIVVAPAPTAVTRPFASTVAAARLLEIHVTTRPVRTLFAASRSVAVSCCVGVTPTTKLAVAGATVTVLTGASVTVIEEIPALVSLVAVIVVAPAPTAVTKPFASTVAAAVLLDVHVTTRPVSTLFAASRSVAVSCCVSVIPTTRLAEVGVTVTVLTGASVTVIEDVPVLVSLVAVMVAGPPAATAVTRPFTSTVATAVLLDVHVTTRPVRTLFAASRSVAVSCCVGVTPTTKLAVAGATVTVLTGASVTVIEDVPVLVSLVAVMVAAPAPTAVTKPLPSTVAAAVLLDVHVTVRPLSTLLFASLSVAVSC
jgi:hypothetical protein